MILSDKVVVVTGAASGIGAAIALSFAKENSSLCIIDKNSKGLLKTKEECENTTKGKVLNITADVSKDDDVKKIVESALKELGKINVLVNCAAVLGAGSLQDANIVEIFDAVMPVNLRAVLVLTKQALPALIENKGCIINISSVTSMLMTRNTLAYNLCKAAVTNFTKCAAFELATHGVRVNCISPGIVKTNLLINGGISEEENDKVWDGMAKNMPLKKCVKAEEIAGLAVYLAGEKAESITGADFVVDGGMLLGTIVDTPGVPAIE